MYVCTIQYSEYIREYFLSVSSTILYAGGPAVTLAGQPGSSQIPGRRIAWLEEAIERSANDIAGTRRNLESTCCIRAASSTESGWKTESFVLVHSSLSCTLAPCVLRKNTCFPLSCGRQSPIMSLFPIVRRLHLHLTAPGVEIVLFSLYPFRHLCLSSIRKRRLRHTSQVRLHDLSPAYAHDRRRLSVSMTKLEKECTTVRAQPTNPMVR